MPTTLALHQLSVIAISLLLEDTSSDFSDLVFTFIKLRLRDKKPPAEFISISSFQRKDEPSKLTGD